MWSQIAVFNVKVESIQNLVLCQEKKTFSLNSHPSTSNTQYRIIPKKRRKLKIEVVKYLEVLWSDENVLQLMNTHKSKTILITRLCCYSHSLLLPSHRPRLIPSRLKGNFSFFSSHSNAAHNIRHENDEERIDFPHVYHKNVSDTKLLPASSPPNWDSSRLPSKLRLSHFIIAERRTTERIGELARSKNKYIIKVRTNDERGHFHSFYSHFYYQRATMCHRREARHS